MIASEKNKVSAAEKAGQELLVLFTAISVFFIVCAFIFATPGELVKGMMEMYTSSHVLTVDGFAKWGVGTCFLNGGLMGLYSILLFRVFKTKINNAAFSAYLSAIAFTFLGVHLLNSIPIALGVYLYSKLEKESFGGYVNSALFGTSICPIVSEMMFGRYLVLPPVVGIPAGILVGMIVGFMFAVVAKHTANVHKGFDLFNGGVAAGFIAVIFYGIYKNVILKAAVGSDEYALNSFISEGSDKLTIAMLIMFTAILVVGIIKNKGFGGYGSMLKESAYKNDLVGKYSAGCIMINAGITGLMFIAYYFIIDANWIGTLGVALISAVCWTASGTNPRNLLPIIIGYALVSIVSGTALNVPGWIIGIGFATGLAPVCDGFGPIWGIVCGALHAILALFTAQFHGGFCLYNGGFTAGLVAVVMVPVMETFKKEKTDK